MFRARLLGGAPNGTNGNDDNTALLEGVARVQACDDECARTKEQRGDTQPWRRAYWQGLAVGSQGSEGSGLTAMQLRGMQAVEVDIVQVAPDGGVDGGGDGGVDGGVDGAAPAFRRRKISRTPNTAPIGIRFRCFLICPQVAPTLHGTSVIAVGRLHMSPPSSALDIFGWPGVFQGSPPCG